MSLKNAFKGRNKNTSSETQVTEETTEVTELEEAVADADETLSDIDEVLESERQANYVEPVRQGGCGCGGF